MNSSLPARAVEAAGEERPITVSMVMAANRTSPFLPEAIDSMARQNYPDIEIVVVDDGSPDPALLADFLSDHNEVILHRQENAGASVARNTGVALSRGELIGFFDDDDRYPPDWVARHVANLRAHPEAVLSYGGVRSIDAAGRELWMDAARDAPDARAVRRRSVQVFGCGHLMRRDIFEAVGGFNPHLTHAEDLDLMLRCIDRGPFVAVDGLVFDYRTHGQNVTADHHALVEGIDLVVRQRRELARLAGKRTDVRDFNVSLARNRRYAVWRSQKRIIPLIRHRQYGSVFEELAWLLPRVPEAPLVIMAKGLVSIVARARTLPLIVRRR